MDGFLSKPTKTAAMWPSLAATRTHWALILGERAGSMTPFLSAPQIFMGSFSLFSSSPLMKGMTLSFISGHDAKVFPAPEIAWYVHTATLVRPNSASGCSAGT